MDSLVNPGKWQVLGVFLFSSQHTCPHPIHILCLVHSVDHSVACPFCARKAAQRPRVGLVLGNALLLGSLCCCDELLLAEGFLAGFILSHCSLLWKILVRREPDALPGALRWNLKLVCFLGQHSASGCLLGSRIQRTVEVAVLSLCLQDCCLCCLETRFLCLALYSLES